MQFVKSPRKTLKNECVTEEHMCLCLVTSCRLLTVLLLLRISFSRNFTLPGSVLAADFRLVTGHDYLQRHLYKIAIKDSPMCALCDDAEEMGLGHIPKCQSLTDNMNNANNQDKWWNLSKLYWTARKKLGDIPLIGAGLKNRFPQFLHLNLLP